MNQMPTSDFVGVLCAMVFVTNQQIVKEAGEGRMPDGGWKIIDQSCNHLTIMSRSNGDKFRISVSAITDVSDHPPVSNEEY